MTPSNIKSQNQEESKIKRAFIACEESQAVCIEFRKLGIEAFSCDILPCSGGHPEWHIQDDVLNHLNDGWDIMIAFPPCTHLSVSGARWFTEGKKDIKLRNDALEFVKRLMDGNIRYIAIENPVSVISSHIRKSDQTINPYQFGHKERKRTCLWLKNLPKLQETNNVYEETMKLPPKERDRIWYMGSNKGYERSKTFPGIAKAMAEQWSKT